MHLPARTGRGSWSRKGSRAASAAPRPVRARAHPGRALVDPISLRRVRRRCEQDPRSNRACRFPAHGLRVAIHVAALRSLRIADGPAQAIEPVALEEVARPEPGLTGAQVPAFAPDEKGAEPGPDVSVDLVELASGVPGAEVVAPTAQQRVQVADDDPDVLHTVAIAAGQLLHALPDALHAARRGPALEEIAPLALSLPDLSAHALAQMATEEVEAFASIAQLDPPRLFRVQRQPEAFHDFADAPLGLLALRLRVAHDHKVVRVAHQRTQVGPPPLPRGVEDVQVEIGQQRRDHSALWRPREHLGATPLLHHSCTQPLPQQLEHPAVRDAPTDELHQLLVVDAAEIVADVRVEHVVAAARTVLAQRLQRLRRR